MFKAQYLSVLFSLSIGLVFSLPLSTVNAKPAGDAVEPLPLEVLKEFTDAFASIKSDYVEVVDDKTILKNAIKGM
ncbi:MAG: peptidase S41, partial [Gammaproteobacteria bacterium]|nr:peptidase S41 [Gammaproteobacteria bacterium]